MTGIASRFWPAQNTNSLSSRYPLVGFVYNPKLLPFLSGVVVLRIDENSLSDSPPSRKNNIRLTAQHSSRMRRAIGTSLHPPTNNIKMMYQECRDAARCVSSTPIATVGDYPVRCRDAAGSVSTPYTVTK